MAFTRSKKVPVVMQLEALECGAACLAMVLAYYKKWIPLKQLRSDCGVSRDGVKIQNMILAARHYDMEADGYTCETEDLIEENSFPCIIHWNFNHFVVLKGFKHNKAYINDPARGEIAVDIKEFEESFTGVVLFLSPNKNFKPEGKQQSTLEFAAKRLKGTGAAIIFTLIVSVAIALMNMISPAFSRIFMDRLLTHQNPSWVMPFITILFFFNLITIIISAVQTLYQLRINGKMAVVGNTTFMWKILHLPMEFFSQTRAGDIKSRQGLNGSIANTLITVIAPLLLNIVLLVFYFVVMIRFSLLLTFVGLASTAVNLIVSRYISKKRVNITRVTMRDSANLESHTVSGIEMIETIKAAGAEIGFFSKWAGYQASVNTQNIKLLKTNTFLGIFPTLASTLANNLVLVLGVFLVMQGEFTIGMVMQFQTYLSMFLSPTQNLISAGQTFQEMRTQMERIDDVMEYPSEKVCADTIFDKDKTHHKLSGKVEIKNLTFGYSKLSAPIIENFNLCLEPGKSVAIVGSTGCGKSTISKLISGLYQPWEGEILFDGKPLNQIEESVFKASLQVVDQDIILFKDTISNNIKMWDDSILERQVVKAAMDAQIHDDIMKLPLNYEYKLNEGGTNLSGGQRQRLEIARVLACDPSVVIMDEATSALDSKTEHDVIRSIDSRKIATIVIAHRLSAIRSCDEIIVMKKGKIVDRGTHSELYNRCSIYNDLVSME